MSENHSGALLSWEHVEIMRVDAVATGERARKRRFARRITLREMARRCGWSAAYVSDLERGRRKWTERKAARYGAALDMATTPETG